MKNIRRLFECLLGLKTPYVCKGNNKYNFHVYHKGHLVVKTKTFQEAVNATKILS